MRILLTGGTGFFGKALLRHWFAVASSGTVPPAVVILSRDPGRFRKCYPKLCDVDWLSFVEGDILELKAIPRLSGITHLLHAAADSTRGPDLCALQRFDQIVNGTRNMLEYSVEAGIPRFLFCSSGGVYGSPPTGVVRLEESFNGIPEPLNPANSYGIAKRAAEHLCSIYAARYHFEVVIARCFAFVGQDLPLDVHFAIGNFIRDALERPEITVAGNGSPLRSYLDQRDLAEWLSVLLVRGVSGRAYNVGSDQAISIVDLAKLVAEVLAPKKAVRILGAPQVVDSESRSAVRSIYVPSIERARCELGLKVSIPLRQAIADAAASHVGVLG
jgi:UDP-glucuronate decarboxylase